MQGYKPLTSEETERLGILSMGAVHALDVKRVWLLDQMITPGFGLITGKKATYKSIFALNVAYGIASGDATFGLATVKGRVLYAALELDDIAMSERCKKLGPPPEGLDVVFDFPRMPRAATVINHLLSMENRYKLIVLDMLPAIEPQGHDSKNYDLVKEFLLEIRHIGLRCGCAILGLVHSAKNRNDKDDDFMATAMNSGAYGGQADFFINLVRARGSNLLTVRSGGNHAIEKELQLQLDYDTFRLTAYTDTTKPTFYTSAKEMSVQSAIESWSGYDFAIRDIASLVDSSHDCVNNYIKKMIKNGKLEKLARGRYRFDNSNKLDIL